MNITPEELLKAVEEGVRRANEGHVCGLCRDNPDLAREMTHVMGMLKDIGDDNVSVGIERVRANSKWVLAIREGCRLTRIEVLKTVSKGACIIVGAGLVVLFGEKVISNLK